MKIGIIGAGFGGLAVGYRLVEKGHDVTIFESASKPGGLAIGYKEKKWKWSLEEHYHHWFTNDYSALGLANDLGHKVVTIRPKTSVYIDGDIFQLDSPGSLLRFNKLPVLDRIRAGMILAYLKYTPYWESLEKVTAENFLVNTMGKKNWEVLWEPLFVGKFHKYSGKIPASWFWARIKKRTQSLSYPEGGFLNFVEHLADAIEDSGGRIKYKNKVGRVTKKSGKFELKTDRKKYIFDKVICTLPSPAFVSITKGLPGKYIKSITDIKSIGAVNLVLSLKKQFFQDDTYWLNINEIDFPFLAVVEHTNFMDKKYYNNEHLLYIGNYLPHNHKYFNYSAKDLLIRFTPYLKKINPQFNIDQIIKSYAFKARFAQPITPLDYSKSLPKFETPIEGLYLCNMQQVYPWDRGTNYAIENGEHVAEMVLRS